jgi:hypothetical protein
MADSAEQPAQSPGSTGIAGIEQALQHILQAVSNGRDDDIEKLMDQMGDLVESLDAAEAHADAQAVLRIRTLFNQATLAMATASQQARGEHKHLSVGKRSLRAYRS